MNSLDQTANQSITLGFVGDIALSDSVLENLPGGDPRSVFSGVEKILDCCDLVVGNLECAIRPDGTPRRDQDGVFTVSAEIGGCFEGTPIRVLSLANNHILDAGPEGVGFTCRFLESVGIDHFGAGPDEAHANRPIISDCKGWKIGFFGASGFSYANAHGGEPGAAPLHRRRLLQSIEELKPACDFIVVVIHADIEFVDFPAPWRVRLSRQLIDAGAGLVIHHHPHVLQGVETWGDGFVAYSLGNWVFKPDAYQASRGETGRSALLAVTVSRDRADSAVAIVTKFHPVKLGIDGCPTALESGEEAQGVCQRIAALSGNYRDGTSLFSAWRQTCKKEARRTLYEIYCMAARDGVFVALGRLRHILGQQLTWHWIRGLLPFGKRWPI